MSASQVADRLATFSVHPAPGAKSNGTNGTPIDDLSKRNYIRWDAEGVEKIPSGEKEEIDAVAEQINCIQKAQWNMHRHCYSGTHARTHGIVKGTFVVHDNLPEHLRQGELFSKGAEYPVACRYSTEPGDPGLDVSIALMILIILVL